MGWLVGSEVQCARLVRVGDAFQAIRVAPEDERRAAEGVVMNDEKVAGPARAPGDEIKLGAIADRGEVLPAFIGGEAPGLANGWHGGYLLPLLRGDDFGIVVSVHESVGLMMKVRRTDRAVPL